MASIIYWHVLKHPVLDLVIRRYPKSHCDKSSKAITLLKLHFFENQLKLLAKIIDIFTCTDLKTQNWVKISYIWPSHIMIDLWRPLSHFEFLRPRAYCAQVQPGLPRAREPTNVAEKNNRGFYIFALCEVPFLYLWLNWKTKATFFIKKTWKKVD